MAEKGLISTINMPTWLSDNYYMHIEGDGNIPNTTPASYLEQYAQFCWFVRLVFHFDVVVVTSSTSVLDVTTATERLRAYR